MNKFAVILASHIPSLDKLWVGEEILSKIKNDLPNADIFVGINPSNCTNSWVELVKKYTNNFKVTSLDLAVGSDASAYQTALSLYKESNKDYDLVWFLHTQATKSNRHDVRRRHLTNLLTKNKDVISFFNQNKLNGGYASKYSPAPWFFEPKKQPIEVVLDKYYKFKYDSFRFISIGTMYVILGKLLNEFINNCNVSFFNEPLSVYENQKTTDLYFFERDFINIVSRLGYIIGCSGIGNDYLLNVKSLSELYSNYLNDWLNKNNLI